MQYPVFNFHHIASNQIDIILHGGSKGKDSGLIQKLVRKSESQGISTLAFDFPYITAGEKPSEGLVDEIASLESILELVNNLGYKKIRFIGKSLGGIVASKFLNNLDQKDQEKYSIIVFGYAMPYINFDNFYGNIVVVHGDNDSHGSVDNVEKSLASSPSQEKQVIAIADADHSFNKEDLKENEAIDAGY